MGEFFAHAFMIMHARNNHACTFTSEFTEIESIDNNFLVLSLSMDARRLRALIAKYPLFIDRY